MSPGYFSGLPTVNARHEGQARDTQRQKLYDSEHAWSGSSPAAIRLIENGAKVPGTGSVSIDACQAYLEDLMARSWFQRRWGTRRISVRHKVSGAATGGSGFIHLPPWARTEAVILHELAHNLTPRGTFAVHGPEFAGVYLELVRYAVGAEAYREQRVAFREARVRVSRAAVPEPEQHRVRQPVKVAKPVKAPPPRPVHLRYNERQLAAAVIRSAVKAGEYGAAGSKMRTAALATARRLEEAAG